MTTTARLTEGVGTAGTSQTRIWEAPRTVLEPTQPPIRWVPWALSVSVKRPGREEDHSPATTAEVKECVELYLHSPLHLHGVLHTRYIAGHSGLDNLVLEEVSVQEVYPTLRPTVSGFSQVAYK